MLAENEKQSIDAADGRAGIVAALRHNQIDQEIVFVVDIERVAAKCK